MESSSLEFLDGLIAEEPLLGQNPNDAVLPTYTVNQGGSSYAQLPPQQRFGINTRPKFIPSSSSSKSAAAQGAQNQTTATSMTTTMTTTVQQQPSKDTKEVEYISTLEMKPHLDIICVSGLHSSSANKIFRQFTTSNKPHFDTLSKEDKSKFALNLWHQLSSKGHRFLKPTKDRRYELFDYDRATKKLLETLTRSRTKTKAGASTDAVSLDTLMSKFTFENVEPARDVFASLPNKKQKTAVSKPKTDVELPPPMKEKKFDDIAMEAITTLLSRQEFADALDKNWGDDPEKRKICEEQVKSSLVCFCSCHANTHTTTHTAPQMLKRYRAAAMNGVSVQEFTERLLPILRKEIEVNHSDSEDPDKDKENSTNDTKQSPEAKRERTKHNPNWGKYYLS